MMVIYMGGFKIYQDNYADFTVVSNKFIDEYMEDANDAQLKIYLYLMRMVNAALPTGISDIADRFNYTEKDVCRALRYWEKKHLLELEFDANKVLIGVRMLPLCGRAIPQASTSTSVDLDIKDASPAEPVITSMSIVKPQYNKEDLLRFKTNDGSSQLVFIAEQYLQKTLSLAELGTLFFLSDTLHFSDDLIDYLLQYCVGREKTDHRYIEAVAMDWAQSGITTAKQAASHARKYDKIVYDVMNALGKTAAPTTAEIAYINKWTRDYAYDMTVIGIACERTVLNTDKRRFNYADSILTRWHEMGIKHKSDVETMDPAKKSTAPSQKPMQGSGSNGTATGTTAASRNKFNQFPQNSYDFDALEKALVNK